jgi:hypothetical protein
MNKIIEKLIEEKYCSSLDWKKSKFGFDIADAVGFDVWQLKNTYRSKGKRYFTDGICHTSSELYELYLNEKYGKDKTE